MDGKKKKFDCVEMKREGAQRIYEMIKGMTLEQELAFWKEREREFLERRSKVAQAAETNEH